MIKAILACDNEGGVSKKGTIPWPKNTKDLRWFKKNTTNNVVVMGSKTWVDPLMPWPLPNRINDLATPKKKQLLVKFFSLTSSVFIKESHTPKQKQNTRYFFHSRQAFS